MYALDTEKYTESTSYKWIFKVKYLARLRCPGKCYFSIHQGFVLIYTMTMAAKLFYCPYAISKYRELLNIQDYINVYCSQFY